MPNFDGTGPAGKGPKTGSQMGDCEDAKPQTRPCDGRGERKGRGRGAKRGFWSRFRRGGRGRQE